MALKMRKKEGRKEGKKERKKGRKGKENSHLNLFLLWRLQICDLKKKPACLFLHVLAFHYKKERCLPHLFVYLLYLAFVSVWTPRFFCIQCFLTYYFCFYAQIANIRLVGAPSRWLLCSLTSPHQFLRIYCLLQESVAHFVLSLP